MNTSNNHLDKTINYNFWIYLGTWIVVVSIVTYVMSQDSQPADLSAATLAITFVRAIICSSLVWIIGKKVGLKYFWVCLLSGLVYGAVIYLSQVITILAFRGAFDLRIMLSGIPLLFATGIILGGVVLAVSYPLQLLFSKIKPQHEEANSQL